MADRINDAIRAEGGEVIATRLERAAGRGPADATLIGYRVGDQIYHPADVTIIYRDIEGAG